MIICGWNCKNWSSIKSLWEIEIPRCIINNKVACYHIDLHEKVDRYTSSVSRYCTTNTNLDMNILHLVLFTFYVGSLSL